MMRSVNGPLGRRSEALTDETKSWRAVMCGSVLSSLSPLYSVVGVKDGYLSRCLWPSGTQ